LTEEEADRLFKQAHIDLTRRISEESSANAPGTDATPLNESQEGTSNDADDIELEYVKASPQKA
jgi:hypothetical protein